METWEEAIKDRLRDFESDVPADIFGNIQSLRISRPAPDNKQATGAYAWWISAAILAAVILFELLPDSPQAVPSKSLPYPRQQIESIAASLPSTIVPLGNNHRLHTKSVPAESVEDKTFKTAGTTETTPDEFVAQTQIAPAQVTKIVRASESPHHSAYTPNVLPFIGGALSAGAMGALTLLHPAESNSALSGEDGIGIPHFSTIDPSLATTHHLPPIKTGLSLRFPISERISVTSGMDYTLYLSRISFHNSEEILQKVHYLGIPLRLDWTFASSSILDAYLGCGLETETCIGAQLERTPIKYDDLTISLLGVTGIQLNLMPWLGFYIEPQLSYNVLTKERAIETWRSEHPCMFTVSSGFRFNINAFL